MTVSSLVRRLVALLAVAAALPLCAAPTIVFWNAQQNADALAAIASDFAKTGAGKVETNWINQNDLRASLLRHATDGDLPDVALVPSDFLALDKELKYSEVPATKSGELVPNAAASGLFEGRALGAPMFWGNHLMLYYNRSLVAKPARSFAEMATQAKALEAKGVRALAMNWGEMYWMVPFYGAYGGWPVDAKGSVTLNTPAMVQTLNTYFGLVSGGLTQKECRGDCPLDRFIAGEFAYSINGDWAMHELREALGDKLGVTTLPQLEGGRNLVPMYSGYVLVFPGNALKGPKRDALLKFLRYMQSPEIQRRWFAETALLPVNAAVYREALAKADDNLKASLNQLRLARAMPNDRGMAFAWEGLAKGFSSMYQGRVNATEAARMMQQHADRAQRRTDY
ncbi:extracellular solute-binding protein [Niveibacterium umoris]|uniref:ABC-type glycerol-3-phosphate transport system substrate-binding protein n=1 Tax=Niveibacterium umoris TaxID=1193620 RepID=A0A840BI00_9RHOO|nr:extracellular solute-binding protein [Niveibacterium umoris]MBB4012610.1 ABC-type glycerol-3-phosphate transport system substrate-binding protein [Niveibacterium umoris]